MNTETLLIIYLTILACVCCVMFWLSVLKPVRTYAEYGLALAEFRREFSDWEREQRCH